MENEYPDVELTQKEQQLLTKIRSKMKLSRYHYHMGEKYLEQAVELDSRLHQMIEERMRDA